MPIESPEMAELKADIERSLGGQLNNPPPGSDDQGESPDLHGVTADDPVPSDEGADDEGESPVEQRTDAHEEGIQKLVDLAQQLEVDPADLYQLKINIEDGSDNPRSLTISELKDQYLGAEQERLQIAQQRAQLEEQRVQMERDLAQKSQMGGQLNQQMIDAVGQLRLIDDNREALEQNWASREATDPGTVALERQKVAARYQQAQQSYHQAQYQQNQSQMQARETWLREQNRILEEKLPDWRLPEKRVAIQRDVSEFAQQHYGVSPQQMSNIDAVTLLMIRDAMHGVKVRTEASGTLSQVRSRGVVLPKGARYDKKVADKDREKTLTTRARTSGRREDRLAAARAITGLR